MVGESSSGSFAYAQEQDFWVEHRALCLGQSLRVKRALARRLTLALLFALTKLGIWQSSIEQTDSPSKAWSLVEFPRGWISPSGIERRNIASLAGPLPL